MVIYLKQLRCNIIVFSSGWNKGVFPTYYGLDEDGNVKMFDSLRETQLDLTKVIVMELEELIQKYGIK